MQNDQVSDKRFYWLKIFALAMTKNWDALEKFSKEKKPPVGKPIFLSNSDFNECVAVLLLYTYISLRQAFSLSI